MSVTITRPCSRPHRRLRLTTVLLTVALIAAAVAVAMFGPAPPAALAADGPANSANARFVVEAYDELLGREVDTAALDYHLGLIAAGGDRSRGTLTYGLLFSAEGSRNEVRRAYDDLLDRQPDAAGAAFWTEHLQGHGVVDLRVLLLASDEYHLRAGGTDAAWLDALYLDVLDRASDAEGRRHWLGLASAGVSRPLIVAGLQLSDEALGRRVDILYDEALGRTPSAVERDGAIAVVRRLGERGLRARLWASDERFERHLNRSAS